MELDLSIPGKKTTNIGKSSRVLIILNVMILLAVIVSVALNFIKPPSEHKGLDLAVIKQLALKLEKQGLNTTAVSVWQEYLAGAEPDNHQAALLWYRIGKLNQGENKFEKALESYYRSESFAKPAEITDEIGHHIQECLEFMGRFAALRHELKARVGLQTEQKNKSDIVVAEIGSRKITRSELDRQIETQIDTQLRQMAAYLPEEQLQKQKETLLKQFSSATQQKIFLDRFMMQELLYRKARGDQLADDPKIRQQLMDQERALLASKVMELEFKDKIKITPGDLETYYKAHQDQYVTPARAQISHIMVEDTVAAQKVRMELAAGMDFAKAAMKFSREQKTKDQGGKIKSWVHKNGPVPIIGNSEDAREIIFATLAGELAAKDITTDQGVHIIKVEERESAVAKTLEEVHNEVARALQTQKQQEVSTYLLTRLKDKYDVIIHQSALEDK